MPQGSMTFNVGAGLPGTPANESIATIRARKTRFPGSWFSINMPLAKLRRAFAYVNAWNIPQFTPVDIEAETARLRAMGVNGMIDLRRPDDPYAED